MSQAKLLSIEEAARHLALVRSKTYELVQSGTVLSVPIGRPKRVPGSLLDTWIRARLQEATAPEPRR